MRPALLRSGLLTAVRLLEHRQKESTRALLDEQLPAARALYARMRKALGMAAQKDDSDLPRGLRWLIGQLKTKLASLFDDLQAGRATAREWVVLVKAALSEHHLAALFAGQLSDVVPAKAWKGIVQEVNLQIEFLRNFRVEVQQAPEFEAGWQQRAASYAESIKTPYWRGRTKLLPLPVMPGTGSQCLTACNCQWDVKPINAEAGDYDAYWLLESGSAHCQTCLQRAMDWKPLQIRGGVLQ